MLTGTAAVAACMALQLAVASSSLGPGGRVAALLALTALAVMLCLRQALGGLVGSRALRAAVVGPIVFSIVLTIVLALDAQGRGAGLLR